MKAGARLAEREFVIDNLLLRIHPIRVIIRWTGLALWRYDFFSSDSFTSIFIMLRWQVNRSWLLLRNHPLLIVSGT